MFYYLSKTLPPLVYPLGLAAILLLVALFLLWRSRRWATAVLVLALALL
ncbi:MAG: YdcF family protein, partial [Caldilineaceae bacterium]|nr:YdcF family protein [Caldilineaceae bacterium]